MRRSELVGIMAASSPDHRSCEVLRRCNKRLRNQSRKELPVTRFLAAFALLATLAVVGCDKNKNKDDASTTGTMSNEPKKMSTDACSHCPGVQTATADGK